MRRTLLLIPGVLATVAFAVIVLVGLPQVMLRRVEAPAGLEAYTPGQLRGRHIYIANGCFYCHSQQLRDPAFTTDVDRGWGPRATVPGDYVYDRPHLLGTMRTGPDLIDVGARLPSREWHLIHLYDPRMLVPWSIMPAFPYLFEEKDSAALRPGDVVVPVNGPRAPRGRLVVATADALALVDYLLSLRRDYPLPGAAGETRAAAGEPTGPTSP
ncbi:MAG TPA: cbb3-type cytochrome c oxidase subunit II [Longimicrobiales bacterium]